MNTDQMIEVLQAFKAGKTIQFKIPKSENWTDLTDPSWDFRTWEYRVKPEPQVVWIAYTTTGKIFDASTNREAIARHLERNCKIVKFIEATGQQ